MCVHEENTAAILDEFSVVDMCVLSVSVHVISRFLLFTQPPREGQSNPDRTQVRQKYGYATATEDRSDGYNIKYQCDA